jgi:DNA-binding LacI/PurR family transcriptional regulator
MTDPIPSQPKARITARDVARDAGVSVAAVSRAFTPGAPIADVTRARILAAAEALGYATPSGRAIGALGARTVAAVMGDMANPFYPAALELLAEALAARGQRLLLHAAAPGRDVDSVMAQVLDHRADAAIIASAHLSSDLARACRARRMPVVLLNRVQADKGLNAVCCDNYGGARVVADRFLAQGHRRIAMIDGAPGVSTGAERRRGFVDRLAEDGIAPTVLRGHFNHDRAMKAAEALLTGPAPPDAIFAANDLMALAALDCARRLGLRVPDDVAIIGFDDIPMAAWHAWDLTTMRQPIRAMLAATLDLIDAQIADPDAPAQIRILPARLMVRGSG